MGIMCINFSTTCWGDLIIGIMASSIAMFFLGLWQYFKLWKPNKEIKEVGFIKKFDNQKKAEETLLKDMKETKKKLDIFTTRGDTFSNLDNKNGIAQYISTNQQVTKRFLISHPNNPFLQQREQELQEQQQTPVNDLKIEAGKSFEKLNKLTLNKVSVRQHLENPVRYRLILLDHCMYISQQLSGKCSQESPIVKYTNESYLYEIFTSQFDDLWEKYDPN